jgi:hypothetical protein
MHLFFAIIFKTLHYLKHVSKRVDLGHKNFHNFGSFKKFHFLGHIKISFFFWVITKLHYFWIIKKKKFFGSLKKINFLGHNKISYFGVIKFFSFLTLTKNNNNFFGS